MNEATPELTQKTEAPLLTDPKDQALATLAAICQEYVNTLNQTGKQVSANLVIQAANQAIETLKQK